MNEPDVIDAPTIEPPNPAFDAKWRLEYAAFLRMLPGLLQAHRGKFVAVHDGRVAAVADTFKGAAMSAYASVGYDADSRWTSQREAAGTGSVPITASGERSGAGMILPPVTVEVIGAPGEQYVLLGRDVLNRHHITLDGPHGLCIIE